MYEDEIEATNFLENVNLIFWIVCTILLGIFTEILEVVCIIEDNDASFKEERFSVFVNFILEKEHSHKYVDPNIEKIRRPNFLRRG